MSKASKLRKQAELAQKPTIRQAFLNFIDVLTDNRNFCMAWLIAGFIFGFEPLVWVGIAFFSFTALFQFITLPVEFNASRRAISVIESNGLLTFEEKLGAQKVLKMAAMTYVAALAVSIAQVLRLILRFTGRRR